MTTPPSDNTNTEGPHDEARRPFYAVAGLTDVVASTVLERVRSGRVMAAERWTQLREQARTRRSDLPRIDLSRINLSDLQERTRTTYASLAVRGKHAVDEARDHARGFAREFGDQYGGRLRTIAAPLGRATDLARPMAERLFKQEPAEGHPGDAAPTGPEPVGTHSSDTPTGEAPIVEASTAEKADDAEPTET